MNVITELILKGIKILQVAENSTVSKKDTLKNMNKTKKSIFQYIMIIYMINFYVDLKSYQTIVNSFLTISYF